MTNQTFWIVFFAILIIAIVVVIYLIRNLFHKPTEFYRYVFIHPAGLDYMKQNHLEPKSFIIPDIEDMMFTACNMAKEYAKKYPYYRVTCTNLPNYRLGEIQQTKWESCSTYFDIYD